MNRKYFDKLIQFIPKKVAPSFLFACISIGTFAETTPNTAESFNPNLMISWLIVTLIALLGIVIHVLGKVLISILKQKLFTNKNMVKGLLLFAFINPYTLSALDAEVAASQGMSNTTFWSFLLAILVIELLIIATLSYLIIANMRDEKTVAEAKKPWYSFITNGRFWDKFNKAKDISEEKSILLDHNYDGIQELDNDLPPWWKYGFYLSIVWAIFYLYYYNVSSDDKGMIAEYTTEMAESEAKVAAFKATQKENVDETNVTTMTESSDIEKGASTFAKNCVACHLADAGGSIGPNLTDKYWMYGGSVKNIFKTIKYGANNGMKAWDELSPVEIQQVASYILSLQGSKPALPKEPQGEIYVPEDTEVTATNVNITTAADTAK